MYHSEPLEAATYVLSELARVRDIDRRNRQFDFSEKQQHINNLKLTTLVRRLSEDYGPVLEGMPEGRYLKLMRQEYQTQPKVFDSGDLDLSAACLRLPETLRREHRGDFVGDFVTKSYRDLLRSPLYGKSSIRHLEDELNALGLGLGMDITYSPSQKRRKFTSLRRRERLLRDLKHKRNQERSTRLPLDIRWRKNRHAVLYLNRS